MSVEKFSDKYVSYRLKLGKEILDATLPYLDVALTEHERLALFRRTTPGHSNASEMITYRFNEGSVVTYKTEELFYCLSHKFVFHSSGELSYHRESFDEDPQIIGPGSVKLGGIDKISADEGALTELSFVSMQVINSKISTPSNSRFEAAIT
ncbi:hypothetical protein HY405_00680 [Candidatus Microgenomates bacterium]|nr:hypothetical protein [Candidatus Microgenomates bacterium]